MAFRFQSWRSCTIRPATRSRHITRRISSTWPVTRSRARGCCAGGADRRQCRPAVGTAVVSGRLSPTEALCLLMASGLSAHDAADRLNTGIRTNKCRLWCDGNMVPVAYIVTSLVAVARTEADDRWRADVVSSTREPWEKPAASYVFEFEAVEVKALLPPTPEPQPEPPPAPKPQPKKKVKRARRGRRSKPKPPESERAERRRQRQRSRLRASHASRKRVGSLPLESIRTGITRSEQASSCTPPT